LILGARWDGAGDLGTDIAAIIAAIGVASHAFQEQPDVAVSIDAIAGGETNVFDLSVADTRYIVRNLRLKLANPGVETCTVRLYSLINDVLTVVDTFAIDAANFATYHSSMDIFGVPQPAGDSLKVTVQMSAGAAVAVTGQYSYAEAS